MPLLHLTPSQRKQYRALAHHLDPVVLVGSSGLTPAVRREAHAALNAHGLIKIRVFGDDRTAREAMLQTLAADLDAAPVQHIGKLLVLWRPLPAPTGTPETERGAAPRDVKVLKYSKRGGQRPEVKTLRVMGNQRLTAGGRVKRSRARQVSLKKRTQP